MCSTNRISDMNVGFETLRDESSVSVTDVLKVHHEAQEQFEEIKVHVTF